MVQGPECKRSALFSYWVTVLRDICETNEYLPMDSPVERSGCSLLAVTDCPPLQMNLPRRVLRLGGTSRRALIDQVMDLLRIAGLSNSNFTRFLQRVSTPLGVSGPCAAR